ncbi:MAG: hypothetical protein GEV09_19495 [Pseudonocardiaceae bacterium]|nr:hypothetical protein [Pseudonocardiaceae bacterium]
MGELIAVVLLVLIIGGGTAWYLRRRQAAQQRELEDSQAEARRWVERLGGQVVNLVGTDEPSKQALVDASERYTAAGSQMESARTAPQCRLVTQTALEGLYYVRAARTAMGIDPGPELPQFAGQAGAGEVTEHREVEVAGHDYVASPEPGERTPHYYPGGRVAGRPVPRGWYSEPWWKPALAAGAWGMGSMLLFSTMFAGMGGIASAGAWEQGYDAGQEDAMGDAGGDAGGDAMGDAGGDMGDTGGGMDFGGGFDF